MPKFLDEMPPEPRKTKGGMKGWQVRILQALAANGGWLSRADISTAASVHPSNQTSTWGLGVSDPVKRGQHEARIGYPTLLTLGYVAERVIEVEEGVTERSYRITPAGVQALRDLSS